MSNDIREGFFDIINRFLFGSVRTRTMVCLAVSRKYSGYCIAGREIIGDSCGEWIRPVSRRKFAEITPDMFRLKTGKPPNLLDVIEVPLVRPASWSYQSENHLVEERGRWKNAGVFPMEEIPRLCDEPDLLWINGYSSARGLNDRFPLGIAEKQVKTSLLLIRPEELVIDIEDFPEGKRRIRAFFSYRGTAYGLAVTDPNVEEGFSVKKQGLYPIRGDAVFLCVSLGEPYEGYVYKLAASIITPF